MDTILIRDLRVEVLIGIHRRERHVRQTLSIDLDIGIPGTAVFKSDKVADTIDYEGTDVVDALKELTGGRGPDACIDAVGMEAHHPIPLKSGCNHPHLYIDY